jgi:hypothetical protein
MDMFLESFTKVLHRPDFNLPCHQRCQHLRSRPSCASTLHQCIYIFVGSCHSQPIGEIDMKTRTVDCKQKLYKNVYLTGTCAINTSRRIDLARPSCKWQKEAHQRPDDWVFKNVDYVVLNPCFGTCAGCSYLMCSEKISSQLVMDLLCQFYYLLVSCTRISNLPKKHSGSGIERMPLLKHTCKSNRKFMVGLHHVNERKEAWLTNL